MTDLARRILERLECVASERQNRSLNPLLAKAVTAVKHYQHARFATTYADFLRNPAMFPACRFFLDELYGPKDFALRDQQFSRIVPKLVSLFPPEVALTVLDLAELHALTEQLDTAMAKNCPAETVDAASYGRAWRLTGRAPDREAQIQLMLRVGSAIDRMSRNPMLRSALRLMRTPASIAGFGALQHFLESGLDAFRSLANPQSFLQTIAGREREIAFKLFEDPPS